MGAGAGHKSRYQVVVNPQHYRRNSRVKCAISRIVQLGDETVNIFLRLLAIWKSLTAGTVLNAS